jgi:hypothetical protein
MASTDYDAPRSASIEPEAESLELLKERRISDGHDLDADTSEDYELPGFEILDEELTAPVVPMGQGEFRCGTCYLVFSRSLHAGTRKGADVCRDCA